MGGCCCSSSRTALGGIPVYYHYPRNVKENEILSSTHDAPTDAGSHENYASKNEHRQSTESVPLGDDLAGNRFETSDLYGDMTGSDPKNVSDLANNSPKFKEEISHIEISTSFFTEDDVCPICLEEFDAENPRINTKCKHHFHLSCILEWFERSSNCAVCDQIMEVPDMDLFDRTLSAWP